MAEINYIYRCSACNLTKDYKAKEPAPVCCAMPMAVEELPVCISAPHAEMARNDDEGEPCDDGRGQHYTKKRDS